MAGCWSRASAFASWRKRAIIPGVHAISGCRTLQARRRSRSTSHSSYTSANPPRPTSFLTWYLGPSARARRSTVGWAVEGVVGVGAAAARSLEITVGDGLPHAGQNAEPSGSSARPRAGPGALRGGNGGTVRVGAARRNEVGGLVPRSDFPPRPPSAFAGLLWFFRKCRDIPDVWPGRAPLQPPGDRAAGRRLPR